MVSLTSSREGTYLVLTGKLSSDSVTIKKLYGIDASSHKQVLHPIIFLQAFLKLD